jgi:hypothetical protein
MGNSPNRDGHGQSGVVGQSKSSASNTNGLGRPTREGDSPVVVRQAVGIVS